MSNEPVKKQTFIHKLSGVLGGGIRAEKSRLEAFLDAVPGEYCGWSADGSIAYSEGFCRILKLTEIKHINDIQEALAPSDSAALEGMFSGLQDDGASFSMEVTASDGHRKLQLSGARGRDLEGGSQFDILWLEDITARAREQEKAAGEKTRAEQERDRLQIMLDTLPMPVWMRDAETNLIWVNRFYAKSLDTTQATVIADQKELSTKASQKTGRKLAQAALDSGQPEHTQAHIIMSGSRHYMDVAEIPLTGQHVTLGIARDISREEELEKEQNRYASANNELLEQLGTAIGIFDVGQRLEFYNSAFSQLWQLEDQYLNNRPKLGDIMEKLREARRLPEQVDFKRFKDAWVGMFTSLLGPHEEMLYLPDDTALRLLAVPHPMGGLMMIFEDVTSRLELESSYNTLIAVQRETLDNLAEGVSVYGGDGRLKLWNPSFARLWNLNPEDLEGEPHVSKIAEKMKARFAKDKTDEASKELVAQSINRRIIEGQMKCADGTLIAYSTVPLPDGGVLVTHVDITDKVRVENALREKNAALETAEQLKLDFLANVSYQLRTPLNAIMGFSEILGNEYFGNLNDRQKEYAGSIKEAGERLLYLIDDILDLSTIEAGYLELGRDKVSISDMLETLHELTMEWARKEGIEVKMSCPKSIGAIEADERRVKQVLLNLIRNAITYTPEGGNIEIAAKKDGDSVAISIKDSGPGISKEDQAKIFEPFEKAQDQGKQAGGSGRGGAGLGLTLVKNIVELHGGKVELESAEGKGTTVTIILPVKAVEAGTDKEPVKAAS